MPGAVGREEEGNDGYHDGEMNPGYPSEKLSGKHSNNGIDTERLFKENGPDVRSDATPLRYEGRPCRHRGEEGP